MEIAIWIVACFVAFTCGYLLKGPIRQGQNLDSDAVRLELDDMYDKIRHLYDRTRKRAEAMERSTSTPSSADGASDPKAALRAAARARGLIR